MLWRDTDQFRNLTYLEGPVLLFNVSTSFIATRRFWLTKGQELISLWRLAQAVRSV